MYTAQASVIVQANPSNTWAYVSNYQNFDKFMSNVTEIKMLDAQQSEWHMSGPLGIPVSWKAITTEMNAPNRLAWKSTEGALENDGFISVQPEGMGSKVTVHVNYNPPLGAIGEFFATLFKDPQAMLEHDLAQLDALISSGGNLAAVPTSDAMKLETEEKTTGGMDGYARVAERSEKVVAVGGVPMAGGMLGYGVATVAASPELDPPDLDSADPVDPTRPFDSTDNDKRNLAEKLR
jgi:ribosome-associated toxin RatA of RatAB toxin-antitoxin module